MGESRYSMAIIDLLKRTLNARKIDVALFTREYRIKKIKDSILDGVGQ